MNNSTKNMLEDSLEEMTRKVEDSLGRRPAGMDGMELEELKEELELCLELVKK